MHIPRTPPSIESLFKKTEPARIISLITQKLPDDRYFHWDELRHRSPPEGYTLEEWWLSLRFHRNSQARSLPLLDPQGRAFSWFLTDPMLLCLHKIDMMAGGTVQMPAQVTNSSTRDQYLVSSLMEEAITSSQLEGAATTREVARDMLRSKSEPRNISERMILNNYLTMSELTNWRSRALTPELVYEIHRYITMNTLDDPTAAGRLRRVDEPVEVIDEMTEEVLHTPPPAETLEVRLQAMCDFANQPDDAVPFVHPIIRAVILHFWLAYDHPFKDGNGRTARALFYWMMLKRGFWLFQFISISQILLKARAQYGQAFLKTETDGNDLNYFLLHQLGVIEQAIKSLHNYIRRKSEEVSEASKLLRALGEFNHRQEALLNRAIRHPGTVFTIESHQQSHRVSYATARSDILRLVELSLLTQRKRGQAFVFEAAPDLEKRLHEV